MLFGNMFLAKWLELKYPELKWIIFINLGITFTYAFWYIRKLTKLPKQYLPTCPKCGYYIQATHIPIIIATGNCTMCGENIINKTV